MTVASLQTELEGARAAVNEVQANLQHQHSSIIANLEYQHGEA